jgi:hypothetical protein
VRVLLGINIVVWGYFSWAGIDWMRYAAGQHTPGYPNSTWVTLYVGIPVTVLLLSFAIFALGRYSRFKRIAIGLQIVTIVIVLPFLGLYSGGV